MIDRDGELRVESELGAYPRFHMDLPLPEIGTAQEMAQPST